MGHLTFKCRPIVEGYAEGEALVFNQPISFLGDVDPVAGVIKADKEVKKVKDRILIFPHGKGSTVGSYVIYGLKRYNNKPKAIINLIADPVLVIGCVLADIPLVDKVSREFFEHVSTGDYVIVDANQGIISLCKRKSIR